MRHVICSTVPPCLQDEVRSTREQGNSGTRRPKNRSGVARRHFRRSVEQLAVAKGASMTPKCASACTSILSLVSSITGGPRPGHVPGSSGVVPPKATCRMLAPNTSLSGQLLISALLRPRHFDGDTISLGVEIVKGRVHRIGSLREGSSSSNVSGAGLPAWRGTLRWGPF